MDTEPTISNNLLYFLNTDYAGIIYFERATGNVTAVMNCEDKRVKDGAVLRIERTIDKDAVLIRGHSSMIPVARWERVCSVCVNVLNFSVTSVNDEASSFPFSHRLAKLDSVLLA